MTARALPCLRPSPAQVCWSLECSPPKPPASWAPDPQKSLLYSFPGPKTPDYTGGSPVRSAAWGLLWKEDLIRAQEDSLQVVMTLMTTRGQSLPTGEQSRVPGRVRGGLKERVMRPCVRARGHVGAVQGQRPSVCGLRVPRCVLRCLTLGGSFPSPGPQFSHLSNEGSFRFNSLRAFLRPRWVSSRLFSVSLKEWNISGH